jgi:hypothetical protein
VNPADPIDAANYAVILRHEELIGDFFADKCDVLDSTDLLVTMDLLSLELNREPIDTLIAFRRQDVVNSAGAMQIPYTSTGNLGTFWIGFRYLRTIQQPPSVALAVDGWPFYVLAFNGKLPEGGHGSRTLIEMVRFELDAGGKDG